MPTVKEKKAFLADPTMLSIKAKYWGKCTYCRRPMPKNSWIHAPKGETLLNWYCTPRCLNLHKEDWNRHMA
jgi:hypothetical protein